jgi:hypothetical protein
MGSFDHYHGEERRVSIVIYFARTIFSKHPVVHRIICTVEPIVLPKMSIMPQLSSISVKYFLIEKLII